MKSRYGAFKGRGRGETEGKWHLVDLKASRESVLGDRRSLCNTAWGHPLVRDVKKVNCAKCLKAKP
jgi:hypothetical protein